MSDKIQIIEVIDVYEFREVCAFNNISPKKVLSKGLSIYEYSEDLKVILDRYKISHNLFESYEEYLENLRVKYEK